MILRNLNIVGQNGEKDIMIEGEKIIGVDEAIAVFDRSTDRSLSFSGALAFPGLINSHDHLDFNLFPPLANRTYADYMEWGRDIHENNRQDMEAVLKIPRDLRTRWGIYKNLLNGVTTVVDHGARLERSIGIPGSGPEIDRREEELISVYQDCHCLHSVAFEKNWKWKINRPFTGSTPFVLHVGEGTDEDACLEIDRLIRWNLFNKPLIGIHGVAMNEDQAQAFKALIWCPAANYFLLGRTAPVGRLKHRVPILFGTDSTLTAGWNIWDHLRLARKENQLSDQELLDSVTLSAAKAWKLPHIGSIAPGQTADLVIARAESFFTVDPEDILLVLCKGKIRLFDASLLDDLSAAGFRMENFHPITVRGSCKYVLGDLPALVNAVRGYDPDARFPITID